MAVGRNYFLKAGCTNDIDELNFGRLGWFILPEML